MLAQIVKGSAFLVGLGVAVGTAVHYSGKLHVSENKHRIHLSRILDNTEPIRDALLAMSEHKRADIDTLERVGRRCASLVETYLRVSSADATTVRASVIAVGSRYVDSIRHHLYQFYKASDIVLVEMDKRFVPVNIDLKHAHEQLFQSLECLVESIELAAREKLEDGVAARV